MYSVNNAMIVKLSLEDVERERLVLRGGSVVDRRRLNVTSLSEGDAILRANGFDLEIDFQSSRKTHDSIITKLLSKRQGSGEPPWPEPSISRS